MLHIMPPARLYINCVAQPGSRRVVLFSAYRDQITRPCYTNRAEKNKMQCGHALAPIFLKPLFSSIMCVLTKYLHLCGHDSGATAWTPEDAVVCPLTSGGARCKRPRVRVHTIYSYCSTVRSSMRGRVRAHCRRKAFREEGWLCHVCLVLNLPDKDASCIFGFSCDGCGAKDCADSLLPRNQSRL